MIGPTLRNLGLIVGGGEDIVLTNDGNQCLDAYQRGKMAGYLKRLGYQIIQIDKKNVNLIPYLLLKYSSKSSAVSIDTLRKELFANGVSNANKATPVAGWIRLLEYVGLVRRIGNLYYCIESEYNALLTGEQKPTKESFKQYVKEATKTLQRSTFGSPYIPIPDIREEVCKGMKISSFTFDRMLEEISREEDLRVVFATPTRRLPGGVTIRGKYYYFIAVYPR